MTQGFSAAATVRARGGPQHAAGARLSLARFYRDTHSILYRSAYSCWRLSSRKAQKGGFFRKVLYLTWRPHRVLTKPKWPECSRTLRSLAAPPRSAEQPGPSGSARPPPSCVCVRFRNKAAAAVPGVCDSTAPPHGAARAGGGAVSSRPPPHCWKGGRAALGLSQGGPRQGTWPSPGCGAWGRDRYRSVQGAGRGWGPAPSWAGVLRCSRPPGARVPGRRPAAG